MPKRTSSSRLALAITPERYLITLRPDFNRFTFDGGETVELCIGKSSRRIELHAKDLTIESAVFRRAGLELKAKSISYDTKRETVVLVFDRAVPKGEGALSLVFHGILNDMMRGFYRSRYEVNGKVRWMATTQFEATDARRAFPCVDEPAAKAVFEVTLAVPKHHTVISNTYETNVREDEDGYKCVTFAPTPRMSTYLLAFMSGEFEYLESKTREGVTVRVFTTPGKKHQAEFALDVAKRTLSFFNWYFAIKYPLPVLDMIAIPDFAAGAMENWGAVTYRESMILVDPANSSTATKQWVALVIAHELAHQWFGNLVTMEWWTHLWLNEGFASWIEYLAVDHIFPEWDIWTQFVYQDLGSALHLDALENSHPIEVEVENPAEIGEVFDAVSYSKGASVIRMLYEYLGEKHFRKGLTHYLKKHQYGNAATNDLWKALEEVSKKPVLRTMQNWTRSAGYPVLSITEKQRQLEVKQERFFSSRLVAKAKRSQARWVIPVSSKIGAKRPEMHLMDRGSFTLARPGEKEWIKLNVGATGVYRVDYPADLLQRLRTALHDPALSPRDRYEIQSDAFAMAEAGRLRTHEALELSLAYEREKNYSVWADLAANIDRVDTLLEDESFSRSYRAFAKDFFAGLALRMGWEKRARESHTDPLLRSLALYRYGTFGDRETVKKAEGLFFDALKRGKPIDPDLRGLVYTLVAEHGEMVEFQQMIRMYREAALNEEKNRIGRALGHFPDEKILAETLKFSISKDVRSQDTFGVLNSAWSSPQGKELAWDFIRAHWKLFLERYGQGGHLLPRVIGPAASFHEPSRAREVETFFRTHEAPGAERTIKQVLERIRSNADWLRRDRERIKEWLRKQK